MWPVPEQQLVAIWKPTNQSVEFWCEALRAKYMIRLLTLASEKFILSFNFYLSCTTPEWGSGVICFLRQLYVANDMTM